MQQVKVPTRPDQPGDRSETIELRRKVWLMYYRGEWETSHAAGPVMWLGW